MPGCRLGIVVSNLIQISAAELGKGGVLDEGSVDVTIVLKP